ncbi:unnamed protein product [Rotaria sordida]|uniref:Uncharacterized protein n=1 Tax=Rotaria sordida TaxID=392033 RepID=A0A819LMK4_9BILA|nr:unnamed protein product [Rotaria sordida]
MLQFRSCRTNDLTYKQSAENIFNHDSAYDKQRKNLNDMIRNYVKNYHDQNRICLIDIDKHINYHSMNDIQEIFNKIHQQS